MSGFLSSIAGDILSAYASKQVRLATPYIIHGLSAGLSGNAILRSLQRGGLGIRRSTGQGLIRALRGNVGASLRPIPGTPADWLSAEQYSFAAYPTRRMMTYVVHIQGENSFSGGFAEQWINISTDTALTEEQISIHAQSVMDGNQQNYPIVNAQVAVEKVLISPIFGL